MEYILRHHLITKETRSPGRAGGFTLRESACGQYGMDVVPISREAWIRFSPHGLICLRCGERIARAIERFARTLAVEESGS
jgi:hypothetical protein